MTARSTAAALPLPPLPDIATPLVAWQRQHGRHGLPWQGTRDPYRVWLSEIMLQQTQVSTVLGYYPRFIARFADVAALAAAPLDDVLAQWSGLGYYSRARNLHRCAQAVVQQHGGRFPASSAQLATLPGIGRSTAAAVAAFCFGERCAILDGNVKRVLGRVLAFEGDLGQARAQQRLWQLAEALVPDQDVAAYTQGLMDLGATLCAVRGPACAACPLRLTCAAHQQGQPERYPVKTRRITRSQRANAWLWLVQGDRLWLWQRPAQGVWAGLWSLPEWPTAEALLQQATDQGWPGQGGAWPPFKHVLTHLDWWLTPVRWQLPGALAPAALQAVQRALPQDGGWFTREQALQLGLPAPLRRLLQVADRLAEPGGPLPVVS